MPVKSITAALSVVLLLAISGCATVAGVNEEPQNAPPYPTSPYDKYVEGKPNLDPRAQGGFYIWRNGNSWHVRVVEKAEQPRVLSPVWPIITGTISLENAVVTNVRRVNIPPLDDIRYRRENITFRFEMRESVARQIAGFDFKALPSSIDYCITLEVFVDGNPRPGIVHLGSFMHIPETLPLRICLRSFDR
ncbi:MAG: hypothetical protein M0Z79_07940 [Nitrospiraceae bacterium]|nr:hypothetical protein [Nitrospiraceae bacterium]